MTLAPIGNGSDLVVAGVSASRRLWLAGGGVFLLIFTTLSPCAFAADTTAPTMADAPKLFQKYCYDCHGDGANKGKIALDDMLKPGVAEAYRHDWTKAWKIVRQEFMPPATAERPSDAERKAIVQWIEQKELGVDYAHPDSGRVTMRRLNRMEYEFTVSDLFGADLSADQDYMSDTSIERLRLRDRLPPDDTAYGFDNNGDFLTLSPILLDKFFNISEYVVDHVISQDGPRSPEMVLPRTMKNAHSETAGKAEYTIDFNLPEAGQYRVELQFTAGNFAEILGTFAVAVKTDDKIVETNEVLVGGHMTHKYSGELTLAKGKHTATMTTEAIKPDARGKFNYLDTRPQVKLIGPLGAAHLDYSESHKRVFFQGDPPADPQKRRAYAKAILKRVADRAFRRPTDDATLERLTGIVMSNDKFERGVGQALSAILTSPRFLFRAELQPQPDDPKSMHPLDEYALASRLSYFLWLSLPDEELTKLAAQGKLRENTKQQVARMLADPKSARFFEDYPGQWLRTRNVLMTPISRVDDTVKPVRSSMKRETDMLFEYIVRNDRDLLELVTADYTFVDRKLANFYGLPAVENDSFQKVQLAPDSKRGGILTQGSFLLATSNPNRTSPVKRGVFVLENLLGSEPPPPPANIPPLDDAKVGGVTPHTVRDQLAAHRDDKSCAACHAHFDPIGIVLENYDLIGRWREKDNGDDIDPRGTMITGEAFSSVDDLRKFFTAHKDRFYRCATEKLMTYAVGRGLEPFDAITVNRITDKLMADNGKFSTLLMAVIESPAFQMRRGDDGVVKEPPRIAMPTATPAARRAGMRRRGNFFNADAAAQNAQTAQAAQDAQDAATAQDAQNAQNIENVIDATVPKPTTPAPVKTDKP